MNRNVSQLATIHEGSRVNFLNGCVDASMCDGFTEMLRDSPSCVDEDIIVGGVISHGNDDNNEIFDY